MSGTAADTTLSTTFPSPVSSACAVVRNFYANYGTDNNLWEFKVGAMSHDATNHTDAYNVTVDGSKVTLSNQIYLTDGHSSHTATDTSVTYVVVAKV